MPSLDAMLKIADAHLLDGYWQVAAYTAFKRA